MADLLVLGLLILAMVVVFFLIIGLIYIVPIGADDTEIYDEEEAAENENQPEPNISKKRKDKNVDPN